MFSRPIEFPTIYHTFTAKDKTGDKIIEYRVQDLPEELFDQALENMKQFYLPEENFAIATRILEDPEAIEDFFSFWKKALKQKVSLACFTNDGSEEFVGVNILYVSSKDDPPIDKTTFKSNGIQGLLKILDHAAEKFNVFDFHNVDKNIAGFGLSINHEYRKRGIATEVLKARISLMKAIGVNLTSTLYTAVGSQKAAAKAGYKENFVETFEDLGKALPEIDFSRSNAKCFKAMDVKI